MNFYPAFRSLFFHLDAEMAHEIALRLLAGFSRAPGLLRVFFGTPTSSPVQVLGLDFPNPVGLAAGMDKNAEALPAWEALGFGFVEVGTITAHPQPGNPRPRLFRYPRLHALVNRMGFNNEGAERVAMRLERLRASRRRLSIPIGINIGKSKVTALEDAHADYLASYRRLYALGDYFVVNVSSPNTPGLRTLQDGDELARILGALRDWEGTGAKPLLVKFSPDLETAQLLESLAACERQGVDGIVATNTTLDHSSLAGQGDETGGLSGAPLAERSAEMLRILRGATALPIIASGGIVTGEEGAGRLSSGASLVQIYTGFVYSGPALIRSVVEISTRSAMRGK